MSKPTIVLRTKGASIIRTSGMTEAALRITPGNPLILYTEVITVIPRGRIRMKISLDVTNTHKTVRCNYPKGVGNCWITEWWRVGTIIETCG